MSVPAFSIPRLERPLAPRVLPVVGALAASATGTLLAVLTAVLASWQHAGEDIALGIALVATAAGPAVAMILYGLDAKGAARIVAGGLAAAPAIAVFYLFEKPAFVSDVALAGSLALLAGAAALFAHKTERQFGLRTWWLLGAVSLGALWGVAAILAPAQVWVEMPW